MSLNTPTNRLLIRVYLLFLETRQVDLLSALFARGIIKIFPDFRREMSSRSSKSRPSALVALVVRLDGARAR